MTIFIGSEENMRLFKQAMTEEPFRNIMRRIKPALHIGVSGTRDLSDDIQRKAFLDILTRMAEEWFNDQHDKIGLVQLHHGLCTGADEAAHWALRRLKDDVVIHGYPGINAKGETSYRMKNADCDVNHPAQSYLTRNHTIVTNAGIIVACPAYPENHPKSIRSGTWATIRMAQRESTPIILVHPDGTIQRSL